MYVLHLTTSFPASKTDAAGAFINRLTNALEQESITCHILTPATTYPTVWPDSKRIHRFRYAPWKLQILAQLPGGIPAALNKSIFNFALLPVFLCSMAFTLCIRAKHYDVIHAHWSICGAIAVITKFLHRKPVIITIHGSDQHTSNRSSLYSWLHRLAVSRAAFTVCVSKKLISELQEQVPKHSHKIHFIANGVTDDFFNVHPRQPAPQGPLQFLTIGSLIPLKGIDTIIKSLANLPTSISWKLSVLGEGIELQNLKHLAEKHNLTEQIHFKGNVAPETIPIVMASHHILILASYREGRPSVILEAMATAMAVIATNINGTKELVQDGTTGWLFTPGDVNALTKIIESIASKEKDIITAGLAGRKWMKKEKLSWSETAFQYHQLYKEAALSPDGTGG